MQPKPPIIEIDNEDTGFTQFMLNHIELDPETFKNMQIDAIRYGDDKKDRIYLTERGTNNIILLPSKKQFLESQNKE